MSALAILLLSATAVNAQPNGVLLDFSATWCGPCQQMSPIVSRLERQGFPIRKVDVDREKALATKFRVSSIPAFVLVINGKEVDRVVGMTSENQLRRMLMRIPRVEQPRAEQPKPKSVGSISSVKPPRPIPLKVGPSSGSGPSIVKVAQSKTRSKPRFQFPFFGSRKKKAREVELEPRTASRDDSVVRAKIDRENAFTTKSTVAQNPLESSTRVRIRDDRGINYGSGTVIDSRPGRTIILTCGHILRDLRKNSKIEVDIFLGQRVERFLGEPIGYDLDADVGLISIATATPIPASKVAGLNEKIPRGMHVFSVGCGGGDPPTKLQLRVTAVNKYRGPENIECTGVPEQGRSGGGLFTTSGKVVGVCIAADPQESRGLYAGLKAVQDLLDRHDLGDLYHRGNTLAKNRETIGDAASLESKLASVRETTQLEEPFDPTTVAPNRSTVPPTNSAADSKRLAEIREAMQYAGQAEVICIIRPVNPSQGTSRVVIINRASSKFISYLRGEIGRQPSPTMHSAKFLGQINLESQVFSKPYLTDSSPFARTADVSQNAASSNERTRSARPTRYRRSPMSR